MSRTLIHNDTTIPYEELAGSPRERFTDAGFEATRVLKCAWPDRIELCSQLLGSVQASAAQSLHVLPARYPHFSRARATSVGIEPFDSGVAAADGDEQVAGYQFARLTVQYATRSFDSDQQQDETSEPFVTESLEPTGEFVTLNAYDLFWSDTPANSGVGLDEGEAPGKLIRGLDWVYTRHLSPHVPAAAFDLIGCINGSDIASRTLGYTFPARTLLYNPPSIRRVITGSGSAAWELCYRFTYRPGTWNKTWRTASGQFELMYDQNGPYAVYTDADFASLLE